MLDCLSSTGILFYCISPTERHAKCLEIAVENGADPNNISAEGIPVLLYACETATDNEEACIQLLEKGANPNGKQEVMAGFKKIVVIQGSRLRPYQ